MQPSASSGSLNQHGNAGDGDNLVHAGGGWLGRRGAGGASGTQPAAGLAGSAVTASAEAGGGDGGAGPAGALPAALTDTVRAAVVEYMNFHGYNATLAAFEGEAAARPPQPLPVEAVLGDGAGRGEFARAAPGLRRPPRVHARCWARVPSATSRSVCPLGHRGCGGWEGGRVWGVRVAARVEARAPPSVSPVQPVARCRPAHEEEADEEGRGGGGVVA
jgi:hypothetical protein